MSAATNARDTLASTLQTATAAVEAVPQLSSHTEISLADAYAVQLAGIELRRRQGDEPLGLKLGFTSREKALQMGVSDVILGVLTSTMAIPAGGAVNWASLIHPRVEPEVAFRLAPNASELPIDDPSFNVFDCVTHVAAGLEVIDSRYRDFSFSLEDVVADNASASRFVVGAWHDLSTVRAEFDISDLPVQLRINGQTAASGSTGAILGNPLKAVADALRLARRYGHPVARGSIVLAGAATPAVPLPASATVTASVVGLGEVSLTTV